MHRGPNVRQQGREAERKVGRTDPPIFMFQPLRTGVLDLIQNSNGLASKAVVVVAPVGYGKTVLMSLLLADLRRLGKQCLWLGLDERDTTAEGVVSTLASMLDGREAEMHPTQALFQGNESLDQRIDALIDLLDRYPTPVTLFIDNLNHCNDIALGRLLDRLIFATRPSVQLVLTSTQDLPINISRAYLEGLMRQIGHSELSFDLAEVRTLLGDDLCTRIGTQGLEEVARHTEGWPAAVRMAQIILNNTAQPLAALATFSGSDEGLAHLLNRQVLSGFPEHVRDFLLCIAPLRSFSLDLAAYVTGSVTASEDFSYLLNRNVFVIPLDRNRSWYRLHGLFREYLLGEAERALPEQRRRELLHRAVLWCEKHGYWREGVDYALESGQYPIAIQILEQYAMSFVRDQGDLLRYVKWIETLHEHGLEAGPEAEYWFVWALAFRRRYDYARQQSVALEGRLQAQLKKHGDADKKAALQRRISILRTSIDSLSDRLEDAQRGAAQWLDVADTSLDDPFNVSAAYCIESCCFTNQFCFVQARRSAQAARESAFQADSAYVDGWVGAYSALVPVYEGDYAAAYPELVAALASARSSLGDASDICGTLALIGAKCAVEMGLEADARQLIQLGVQSSRTHGFLEAAACGVEAALLLWRGGKDDPLAPGSLRDVVSSYPPRLALMLSCQLIRRLICMGRKEEAVAEAIRVGLAVDLSGQLNSSPPTSRVKHVQELLDAARIDLLIATGHLTQAEAMIAEEVRQARASGRMARQVELELNKATIAMRSDRTQMAVRSMMRAISLAAPRRIVRMFDDHAEIFVALLESKKVSDSGFVLQDERRFFGDICQRLPVADTGFKDLVASQQGELRLLSALTPRELELLALVDAGLSNQQLADRTNVSLTTIKWHLQNLYRKLGVSSRSAALARARALGLLHQ